MGKIKRDIFNRTYQEASLGKPNLVEERILVLGADTEIKPGMLIKDTNELDKVELADESNATCVINNTREMMHNGGIDTYLLKAGEHKIGAVVHGKSLVVEPTKDNALRQTIKTRLKQFSIHAQFDGEIYGPR